MVIDRSPDVDIMFNSLESPLLPGWETRERAPNETFKSSNKIRKRQRKNRRKEANKINK